MTFFWELRQLLLASNVSQNPIKVDTIPCPIKIMLQHTFIHIPGIGKQTELDLWKGGIHNWDDADSFQKRFGLVGARLQMKLDEYIPASRTAIRLKNAAFFERLSTLGEAWRVFPEFADQCVFQNCRFWSLIF